MSDYEKVIDKTLKSLEKTGKSLEGSIDKAEEALKGYSVSMSTSSMYNRVLNLLGFKVNNLESLNLKELKKYSKNLRKEEDALRNVENSFLPTLARTLYGMQGGIMDFLADVAAMFGPQAYVIVRILEEVVSLIAQGGQVHIDLYKSYYEGLASAGKFDTKFHKSVPLLMSRMQHLGAQFSFEPDEVLGFYKNYMQEGGGLNFTGDLDKDLRVVEENIIKPISAFSNIFSVAPDKISSDLGRLEFETGMSSDAVRRRLALYAKSISGVPTVMSNYYDKMVDLESSFANVGGLSSGAAKYIGSIIKANKGNKASTQLVDDLNLKEGEASLHMLLFSTALKDKETRDLFKSVIDDRKVVGDFDKSLHTEAKSIIDKVERGYSVDYNDVLVLKDYLEPGGALAQMLQKTLDSISPKLFVGDTVGSFFRIPYKSYLMFINGNLGDPKDPEENEVDLDEYYKLLLTSSSFLRSSTKTMWELLELQIRQLKLEILLPVVDVALDSMEDLFRMFFDSYFISEFMGSKWRELPKSIEKINSDISKSKKQVLLLERLRNKVLSGRSLWKKGLDKTPMKMRETLLASLNTNKAFIESLGDKAKKNFSKNVAKVTSSIQETLLKEGKYAKLYRSIGTEDYSQEAFVTAANTVIETNKDSSAKELIVKISEKSLELQAKINEKIKKEKVDKLRTGKVKVG